MRTRITEPQYLDMEVISIFGVAICPLTVKRLTPRKSNNDETMAELVPGAPNKP